MVRYSLFVLKEQLTPRKQTNKQPNTNTVLVCVTLKHKYNPNCNVKSNHVFLGP